MKKKKEMKRREEEKKKRKTTKTARSKAAIQAELLVNMYVGCNYNSPDLFNMEFYISR